MDMAIFQHSPANVVLCTKRLRQLSPLYLPPAGVEAHGAAIGRGRVGLNGRPPVEAKKQARERHHSSRSEEVE